MIWIPNRIIDVREVIYITDTQMNLLSHDPRPNFTLKIQQFTNQLSDGFRNKLSNKYYLVFFPSRYNTPRRGAMGPECVSPMMTVMILMTS